MSTRTIQSAEEVREIFTDPQWRVRPAGNDVPEGLRGSLAGDIFANFARMSEGANHQRRKQLTINLIDSLEQARIPALTRKVVREFSMTSPRDLQFLLPGMIVSRLLGVPEPDQQPLVEWVRAFVIAARPTASQSDVAAGIEGIEQAVPVIAATLEPSDGNDIEAIASRISLLFQASDACAALIGNALIVLATVPDPSAADAASIVRDSMHAHVPVRTTSRFQGNESVVLDVEAAHQQQPDAEWTFGFGPHACPGRSIAKDIAVACIEAVIDRPPFDLSDLRQTGWKNLPNVWIPTLTLQSENVK